MSAPYELVRTRSGAWSIRSEAYDEICHPGVGPRAEADALYVQGLDLPRRLAETTDADGFVVWDIGLGGAANATAVIAAAAGRSTRLQVVSFDHSLDQLEFALCHPAELDYFGALAAPAKRLLAEPEVAFLHGRATVRWSRVVQDFPAWLGSPAAGDCAAPHAILFDPHSPAANPEMWTLPLFQRLFTRLDPARPCALATYSRSTAVRSALLLAGFRVGFGAGTATKEETTVAANHPSLLAQPLTSDWLGRARRSHAAEPWSTPPFGARPLRGVTYEALARLPQFQPPA